MVPGRTIGLAVDDSECSLSAAQWACMNLALPDDRIHLLGVISPVSAGMGPAPLVPGAEAAVAMAALKSNYQEQYLHEEKRCKNVLRHAEKVLSKVGRAEVTTHCLPPGGGASGVAESVVEWVKKEGDVALVVLGCRGMGAAKSTLMSLVGLGSVSSYCLHYLDCPVCLVRGTGLTGPRKASNRVMVAVDDSDLAQRAQRWAIDNVLGPHDELHLVSVATPVPYVAGVQMPVGYSAGPAGDFEEEYRGAMEHTRRSVEAAVDVAVAAKIATEDAAAAHPLEAAEAEEASMDSRSYARETVAAAVEEAARKVERGRILYKALEPEGGASDVGLSLKNYAKANGIDLVVMGSRGMGAVKRALLSLVGLGSVSEWCCHNLECPGLIIIK